MGPLMHTDKIEELKDFLKCRVGDVWVSRCGQELEWLEAPEVGDCVESLAVLVNGKVTRCVGALPGVIQHPDKEYIGLVHPRDDVTVFRNGECIRDGGMLR